MRRYLFAAAFVILLAGCKLKYQDVSQHPEYVSYIGRSYSISTRMLIYGVNLPPGYGKDIDVYIITPNIPGMTGPEVISKDYLDVGESLIIKGIKRSTNHLAGQKDIKAVVEIQTYKNLGNIPAVIDLEYIESMNYIGQVEVIKAKQKEKGE